MPPHGGESPILSVTYWGVHCNTGVTHKELLPPGGVHATLGYVQYLPLAFDKQRVIHPPPLTFSTVSRRKREIHPVESVHTHTLWLYTTQRVSFLVSFNRSQEKTTCAPRTPARQGLCEVVSTAVQQLAELCFVRRAHVPSRSEWQAERTRTFVPRASGTLRSVHASHAFGALFLKCCLLFVVPC